MGCANAKASGVTVPNKSDFPIEVTDGVGRLNYLNQPPPKVVINGDYLDNDHIKAPDSDDKANGNVDDNIIDTTVKEVNPASQEIEFLTPPDILTIDDKEAVAERTGDSPIEIADGGADDVSTVINEVTNENDPPGSDSSAPALPEQEEEDEDVAMADDSQTTIIAAVDVPENVLDDVADHTQGDEAGEGSNEVEDDEGGSDQVADDQAAGDEVADDEVVDDRKADDEIGHDNKVDNAVVSDDMIVQDAESV